MVKVVEDEVAEDEEKGIDEETEIIVYADDNTPSTAAKDPENLQNKIQAEVIWSVALTKPSSS